MLKTFTNVSDANVLNSDIIGLIRLYSGDSADVQRNIHMSESCSYASFIFFTLYFTCTSYLSYYSLKWQAWQCMPERAFSWNVLSLFTKLGMLFLEVSLIAFLLQGNDASGFESLAHTFVISGAVVAADVLLKV
jgi:hypothetical protein